MRKNAGYQAALGVTLLCTAGILSAVESTSPAAVPAAPVQQTTQAAVAVQATPATANTPDGQDAATFAGNVNPGERYLRLGMLALENDDSASAVNFLETALNELQDPSLRRQAAGMLHQSLLDVGKSIEADKLLAEWEKSPDFTRHPQELHLMQGRRKLHAGDLKGAAEIFRELSIRLQPGDTVCMQALELLARTLVQSGDMLQAEKSYADLAAVAFGNDLWSFKAREGMIFAALAAGDQAKVKDAWQQLQTQTPAEIQELFRSRMTKLSWLVECSSGQTEAAEKAFDAASVQAAAPDPLLARVALAIAENADPVKNSAKAVKYAKLAYHFAENSFRQFALGNIIDIEIKAGLWSDALASAERYLEIFPAASDRDELLFAAGSLNNQLNRTDAALEYFRKIYDDGSADVALRRRAALELAKLYQKNSRTNEAVSMLEFAIRTSATAGEKSDCQQQLGEYLYLLGRYADAAESFEAAAVEPRNREKSTLFLTQSLYQLKSYAKARTALEKILNTQDNDLKRQASYMQALLAEQLMKADDAVKLFLDFANAYPQSAEAPNALFQAGALAVGSSCYSAQDIFLKYAEKYPGEHAANALYKALEESLRQDSEETGKNILAQLDKNYPDSKYTIGGHFRMISYLRQIKRYKEALASLDVLAKRSGGKNSELQSELLYDRVLLLADMQDYEVMLQVLEELVKQHSDKPVAPRAFLLYGDWLNRQGKFAEARTAFLQAQERSAGLFSYGCAGRAADAAYSLYASLRQEQYLQQAQDGYSNLLKVNTLPAELYFQTLYKLARCRRDAGDDVQALRLCREIIYKALLAREEMRYYPVQWCAKALDMALKLLIAEANQASAAEQTEILLNEARRLLNAAGQLDLPGEDIAAQQAALEKIYLSK